MIPTNGELKTVYDVRNLYSRNTVFGARARRSQHYGGRVAVLRRNDSFNVDMLFLIYVGKYVYAVNLSAAISQCYMLLENKLSSYNLYYTYWYQP